MRPCFAFTAKTATKPAVLAIDDEIGFWGVQAKDFRTQLDAVDGDELVVEINSPGGDVFAGLGMYNMLRSFSASGKKVTTRITGIAASIASVIFLAGDKREMPENAMVMIHGVAGGAWGTVGEIEERAAAMKKVQASMQTVYTSRLGIDETRASELTAKDNWFSAQEALSEKIATDLTEEVKVTAKFNVERADLPEHVAKLFAAKTDAPPPVQEPAITPEDKPAPCTEITPEDQEHLQTPVAEAVVALAKTAGLEAHASFLALSCTTVDEAKARLTEAREIVALCTVAGQADKAAAHIRAKAKIADVRAALVEDMAASDAHIDATQGDNKSGKTGDTSASPPVVNTASIWASHNKQLKKGA